MTQTVTLLRSEKYALNNTQIALEVSESEACPFNTTIYPTVLDISIDKTFTPTIRGSADFQGVANFKFSLMSDEIYVYEKRCTDCATEWHADNYFTMAGYHYGMVGEQITSGLYFT